MVTTLVQQTVLQTYHGFAHSAQGAFLRSQLQTALPLSAQTYDTVDAWTTAVGAHEALRETTAGLVTAMRLAGALREYMYERDVFEDQHPGQPIPYDTIVALMQSGAALLVGVLNHGTFVEEHLRTDFLEYLREIIPTVPAMTVTDWLSPYVNPFTPNLQDVFQALEKAILDVDRWQYLTDRTWCSERDEPWILWTRWMPQLWPIFRDPTCETRILTPENIGSHAGGNNFRLYWEQDYLTNWRARMPVMWRFSRAHPQLDAALRVAVTSAPNHQSTKDLLWRAYQILSGPEYDDLRDAQNQAASYWK